MVGHTVRSVLVVIVTKLYLLTQLSADERQDWRLVAATHYQQQHDYLQAAYHLRRMGNEQGYQLAAQTLVDKQQAIVNRQQTREFGAILAEFQRHELDDTLWFQLKIVAGDLAFNTQNIDTAINEYRHALSTPDLQTRALAYYRRAQAYKHRDIDQALAHYQPCI